MLVRNIGQRDRAAAGTRGAVMLLIGFDADLPQVVALSLLVSVTATLAAAALGLPLGAILAVFRFRGRLITILVANALLGLPPVVVGLVLYLLLSWSGPLGVLNLLFTPAAMILAQFLLALPIVTALSHSGMAAIWSRYGNDFLALGFRRGQALPHILSIGRVEALTATLAGFGRTVSEVGAILIVGGNIAGSTRTMTTAITLETAEGHFARALALGIILIVISLTVSAVAFLLSGRSRPNEAYGEGP
jgi:tungstate transport system permease protein